jgi:tetratricopeptide (TPR) repeat protein
LAQVTEAYHPDHLVITTITKKKDHLTLNVQVADTKTWRVRWGRQYEGTEATYNDLMREAAASIAVALKPGGAGAGALAGSASSSGVELALGEGKYFYNRYMTFYREQDCDLSLSAYQRAFTLDPKRADTAARIAMVQESRGWLHGDFSDGGISPTSPEGWAHRALNLDPRCGLAWSILGNLETHRLREDPEKAVEYAVKGASFSPREPRAHLALGAIGSGPGSVGLFIATGRRASELDPIDPWTHGFAALGLAWMGRAEEALPIVEHALRLEPDHRFLVRNVKAYAMLRLGRLEEAERLWHSFDRPPSSEAVFWLAAARGEREKARQLAGPLFAKWLGPKMRAIGLGNAVVFNVPYLVRAGLEEEALQLLQRSVDRGTAPPYDWLLRDPEVRKLQRHSRMVPILAASRNGAGLVARELEAARARGELPTYLEAPLTELRGLVDRPLPGR